jgi:hypothetical protein
MKPRAAHAEATARMSAPVASPRSAVLTKATVRVARQLDLGQGELGKVLGLSPATVSRMFKDEWAIPEGSKAWELAAMLVRVFRSLDAVVGGNDRHVQQWFGAENVHLGGVPSQLVLTIEGLTNVARYLDAMRGAQ